MDIFLPLSLEQWSTPTVYIAVHLIRYFLSSRDDSKEERYVPGIYYYDSILYKRLVYAWNFSIDRESWD